MVSPGEKSKASKAFDVPLAHGHNYLRCAVGRVVSIGTQYWPIDIYSVFAARSTGLGMRAR
jgi:hypothetical protein